MPDPGAGGLTTGEAGGLFAGMLAIAAAIGKGVAWFLNWRDGQAKTRTAKLDVWQEELKEREKRLDAKIGERMGSLEHQVEALTVAVDKWRMAFHLVAGELLQRNPQSKALIQAQKILAEAFPISLDVPADMAAALDRLDAAKAEGS